MWDWNYTWEILPQLLKVVPITITVTVLAFILACILAIPLAIAKQSQNKWVSIPVLAVTDFIRKTPLIIQLFILVFVLPTAIGLTLSPFIAGMIGLGIHYCTYLSEVYRSGIEAVPRGQWEASTALNFSKPKTWLRVILPQSIPPTIPVMGNYLIVMFKETPTLSAITLVELLMTAKTLGSASFKYVEALTLVGIIFLALSYPSALLVRALERKMQVREGRTVAK